MAASSRKGRLVEQIVANLHSTPGVEVQIRAMLPPNEGKGRKREIDILLTTEVVGYPIRLAIECKNEGKPIEAPYIDAFVGKLTYLGIPTQHGIFISATRYTIGAQERAKQAGIKLLNLTGLSPDRLSAAIFEAFQSVIFLFLQVKTVSLASNHVDVPLLAAFVNEQGQVCGTIFDPIWLLWVNGMISPELGSHEFEVDVPEGWLQETNGKYERVVDRLAVTVQVTALVLTYQGQFTEHTLLDASNNSMEKWRLAARFDIPDMPVTFNQFFTETELEEHVNKLPGFRMVTGRYLLPRIDVPTRFGPMFWPPSEKSAAKMEQAAKSLKINGELDPQLFGGVPIDERTMNTIVDPVWSAYILASGESQEHGLDVSH